jgi:hypothetical protein
VNWRPLLVVFGAAIVAFVAYDVVVGPTITSLVTKPDAKT